jgi:hypothetical protein
MHVRHLDHGQQRQQGKTHHGNQRQSAWLWPANPAQTCPESAQRKNPCIQNTQYWMRESRSGLRKTLFLPHRTSQRRLASLV